MISDSTPLNQDVVIRWRDSRHLYRKLTWVSTVGASKEGEHVIVEKLCSVVYVLALTAVAVTKIM